MADGRSTSGAGLGLGGILVIVGLVVAIAWSLWLGILIAIVGLVAFGYPADRPLTPIARPNRRPPDDVIHRERW